ncbi:hypothetical protein QP732_27365 [Klebsiella oxytoca]|uniref:fimbrial protein n=1 Tax=Klebsiella oxytoca TaxID=571 RepID=UPI001CCAC873|nr:hypothetical protein [Klebsiella oxytoca]EIZ1084161.1 type 1 fimbrial protein [Klebsiella oxytoca]ELK0735801.1 type 1 fimbrial protein [Klebsiella oxytoca]ELW9511641.1 type 1 fimbrial protein [Klebsiella oxytoca]MBS6497234.1 type 1 fimbrial protein [Klebsiella oxytoca]MBZ7713385.1 type 1 fimbrial protein [Klebsiella oxytoca]
MAALISLWSSWGQATIICEETASGRSDYVDYSVPILGSGMIISAMRDLPIGGILFRQVIKNPDTSWLGLMFCGSDTNEIEFANRTLRFGPEGALPAVISDWSGHNVYDTGVPGIGMVLRFSVYSGTTSDNKIFPYYFVEPDVPFKPGGLSASSITVNQFSIELLLVKTGDIPAGTWSVPINLPPMVIDVTLTGNVGDFTKDYGPRLNISGAVNILAGTCQTPDVNVPMGEHDVSGSTVNTNWVDFNISLLNCPPMYGRYGSGNPTISMATNQWLVTGSIEGPPDQPNTLGLSLNPVSGYETLASGGQCAKLTPGTDTASGACLEIQNATGTNVLTNSFTNTVTDSGLTLLASAASYQIPLKARYGLIAGSSTMTAGKADSAIEFTINYQ